MTPEEFQRGWRGGLPETPCGSGSKLENTLVQRTALAKWAARYDIETVADIGAGDLNWSPLIPWNVKYRAYDLVPRAPEVQLLDIVQHLAPRVDLLMCLWLLNHLPMTDAWNALENLRHSGSRYLAYTYWPAMYEFLDLPHIESVIIRPDKWVELRLVKLC